MPETTKLQKRKKHEKQKTEAKVPDTKILQDEQYKKWKNHAEIDCPTP